MAELFGLVVARTEGRTEALEVCKMVVNMVFIHPNAGGRMVRCGQVFQCCLE